LWGIHHVRDNIASAHAYVVCVEFKSGSEAFACESYRLLLPTGFDIAAAAHALAEASPYRNEEIAELTRSVFFAPLGDDDPDPPVPGAPACRPPALGSDLEIGHFLVLSAAHLRSATGGLLDTWAKLPFLDRPLSIVSTECGWFMPAAGAPSVLPDEVSPILDFARRCGCQYVLFDCDATPVVDLPIFPW
jgi:hypothetical protein